MNHEGEIFCFINNTTLIRVKTIGQLVMVFPGGYSNFHNEPGEYTSAQAEVNWLKYTQFENSWKHKAYFIFKKVF